MKKVLVAFVFFALSLNVIAIYANKIKSQLTFTSNYLFDGFSFTNNKPALQGTATYSFTSGYFLSLFSSNASLDSKTTSIEVSPTLGWRKHLNNWYTQWDIIYDAYLFVPADITNPNFIIIDAGLGYHFPHFQLASSVRYSPDYQFRTGQFIYPGLSLKVPLGSGFNLISHINYAFIQRNDLVGVPNYAAWQVGIEKKNIIKYFNLGLFYYDTSVNKSRCFQNEPSSVDTLDICGPGVYLTLSFSHSKKIYHSPRNQNY